VCSTPFVETSSAKPAIVDISDLDSDDLEPLWVAERNLWRDVLAWDVTPVISAIRRAVDRKTLAGKAAQLGRATVGYGYYMLEGHRAVIGSLACLPRVSSEEVGARVLDSLVAALKSEAPVTRIESQFVSFGGQELAGEFASHGFEHFQRAFLRRSLGGLPPENRWTPSAVIDLWDGSCLERAARLMQLAHEGRVDAQMNELYRTQAGCQTLLQNIIFQRGCGKLVPSASFVAREASGDLSGFVISTEISPRNAHLAQIAVEPDVQGRGLGRAFLVRTLHALARAGYETVSLMVSGSNEKAYALYESTGFEAVIDFPVFSWDR
jgi:ribosomal protein S18 acetylase RimI-like enzyme